MEFAIKTTKKEECIDLTKYLEEALSKSKIKDGILNIFATHASAAIIINENEDPEIQTDFLNLLNKLIPQGVWKHDRLDGNGASHIKSSILGPSETIPIKEGKLQLGQYQACMFVELDGPRERKIIIKIIKE